MAKRYRLKNVRPSEVSLVNRPAFQESEWLIVKSMAVKFDGLQFTGKPLHEWLAVESIGGDDLTLLCTAIVLKAGDVVDGHKFTADEVAALQQLWARRYARPDTHLAVNHDRRIQDGDNNSVDTMIAAFGMTDDKPGLRLFGAGDAELPANAWFVQLVVGDHYAKTASRIIGDKRVLNGLAVTGPAVLMKGHTAPEGFVGVDPDTGLPLEELDVDPAELGKELASVVVEEVLDRDDEVAPADLAGELMGELLDVVDGDQ